MTAEYRAKPLSTTECGTRHPTPVRINPFIWGFLIYKVGRVRATLSQKVLLKVNVVN